jgi:hypothetical protein
MTTKTTKPIDKAIADIFGITNRKSMSKDMVRDALIKKGHAHDTIIEAMNCLLKTGIAYVNAKTKNLEFFSNEGNEQKPEQTKKGEKDMKEKTVSNVSNDERKIIEGIFNGKKELTALQLGRALSDYFVDPEERKQIREGAIKAGIIEKTKEGKYRLIEKPVKKPVSKKGKKEKTIITSVGINPEEVKKSEYQKKEENKLVAMIAIREALQTAIIKLDTCTLKQVKSDVYNLLNTEGRKNLSNDFITIITEANNTRVKKDYVSELRIAIKEINRVIEQEKELQEKDEVIVSIPEKVKALSPDTAMLINQLDMKEKSRFDCLFDILQKQDKQIKELHKLVSCHKDTINLLITHLNTGNGNIAPNNQKSVKQAEKTVKTKEEIQAENRLSFIMGLTKIEKAIFGLFDDKNALSEKNIIVSDTLEDFSPKMVKGSIKRLVKVGLLDCTKNAYSLAPVTSFKGDNKTGTGTGTDKTKTVKTENKPEKKTFTRGKASGKFTRKQAIQQAIEEIMKKEKTFTMKDILLKQDDIFVAAGGNSNPKATNATSAALNNLIEEGLLKKNGRKYIVK